MSRTTTKRRPRGPTRKQKARKKGSGGPSWLTWVLLVAIILLVAGIGIVKWADTDKGHATLLKLGADTAYPDVQAAVEHELIRALPDLQPGPATQVGDHDWPHPDPAIEDVVRCRMVELDSDVPYEVFQLDLDRKLRTLGAQVLWAQRIYPDPPGKDQRRPNDQKDALRLDVGVPGRPTHALLLHRHGQKPDQIWSPQPPLSEWDMLVESARHRPVVAVVMDDWGNARNETTTRLLGLEAPLTMAVLPKLANSRHFALKATDLVLPETARHGAPVGSEGGSQGRVARLDAGCFVELRQGRVGDRPSARRREVMLHLPMEPQDYPQKNPGADPILVGMDRQKMEEILVRSLQNVPNVRGVNNHMGSAATSDQETMDRLMGLLKERDLFFLDSLTTSRSVAYRTARDAGIPALRNRIFLDFTNDSELTISANLDVAVRKARKTGFAVIIGHLHPTTARVLARRLPALQEDGVLFVTVSEMIALQSELGSR